LTGPKGTFPSSKKFEGKYGFADLGEMNNFLIEASSDSEWIWN
jgi:hypothetical protein